MSAASYEEAYKGADFVRVLNCQEEVSLQWEEVSREVLLELCAGMPGTLADALSYRKTNQEPNRVRVLFSQNSIQLPERKSPKERVLVERLGCFVR